MDKQAHALKIIDRWIRAAIDPDKRKMLLIIQDLIHNDLAYIRNLEILNDVIAFLDADNQENEDLKTIREFIKL